VVTLPSKDLPKSSLGRDMASGIGVSVLVIVLAIFGLIWLAHHRARSRVNGRLKEVRARATELLDRRDALRERGTHLPARDAGS
jgi:hypothetical protein